MYNAIGVKGFKPSATFPYYVIILDVMSFVKRLPVLPTVFVNQVHTKNWNNNQCKTECSNSKRIIECGSSNVCCLECDVGHTYPPQIFQ